jgi:hypothetical protein
MRQLAVCLIVLGFIYGCIHVAGLLTTYHDFEQVKVDAFENSRGAYRTFAISSAERRFIKQKREDIIWLIISVAAISTGFVLVIIDNRKKD